MNLRGLSPLLGAVLTAVCAIESGAGCKREQAPHQVPADQPADQPPPAGASEVAGGEAPPTGAEPEPFTVPEINLEGWKEVDRKQFLAEQERARQNLNDPQAIGALGLLYLAKNVPGPAAMRCFAHAIRLQSDDMRWHYYAGYTYRRDGMPDKAVAAYERALELDPSYAPSYVMIADLIVEEDLDRAETLYRRAAELDPRYAEARFGLGQCANLRGQAEAARQHFEAAVQIAPQYPQAHYQLSVLLRRLGEAEKAAEHLQQFQAGGHPPLTTDPLQRAIVQAYSEATILKHRAMDLLERGRKAEAIQILERVIELDPESATTHYKLGLLYTGQGRIEEAVEQLRIAYEIDPSRVDAKSRYGQELIRLGREEEGERALREVLEQQPNHGMTLARMGLLMERRGRDDEALSMFQRASQLVPDNATVQYEYGRMLARLGRDHEAREPLQAAQRIDPNRADIRQLLADVEARLGAAPTTPDN